MPVAGESQAVDLSFRVELVKEPLGEVLAVLDEQVVGQVETITLVKVVYRGSGLVPWQKWRAWVHSEMSRL